MPLHEEALFLYPKFKRMAALCNSEKEQVTALTKDLLQTPNMPASVQRRDRTYAPHIQIFHDN